MIYIIFLFLDCILILYPTNKAKTSTHQLLINVRPIFIMARIKFSSDYSGRSSNFCVLNAKHTADGVKSMIKGFITENEIDLVEDAKAKTDADTADATRKAIDIKLSSDKKTINNQLGLPYNNMRRGAQYLKRYYKNNATKLKLWGIIMGATNNIKYPTTDQGKIDMVNVFWSHHGSFPVNTSPLQNFVDNNKIDTPTYITDIAAAVTAFATYKHNVTLSEQQRLLRDETFTTAWEHTKAIGNYLHKLNVINPKDTCNWGFNIIEESHVQSIRKSKLNIGEKMTVSGTVLDTSFTNTGTNELHLFKGKSTTGTPTIVHAGEHFVLIHGYSSITISNPSPTTGGKFEVTINK